LQPQRDLNRNPLFQVMFQFQNTAPPQPNLNGLSSTRVKIPTETAKFDLLLLVREQDDALLCVMEYNSDLFDGETIERMLGNYATLLESIVTNPDAHIADLPLLTTSQRQQILIDWNATTTEFPYQKSIHQLFQEQVQLTPRDVAVVCDTRRLTFAELNARANQLAHYLRKRGVGPEVRVAICVERSVEMIVGLLAILKAGGTYVPLEPSFPAERIAFIQADSQARVLLTQQHLSLMAWTGETVYLDNDWPEIARESPEAPIEVASAENSAHVIYTSGSTGRPKGVVSSHRASINRFAWMWRTYPFAEGEVCCQKTSLSFSDSIWEIFGPLLQGVPLVLIPDEVVKDPKFLIGVTQPRRVAALSIARRLAQELDVQYGREVGSKIRFNDETSRDTVIKIMTDGILLAETQTDPDLRQYNCIIIDEAHERSLNIDFLLGHLKLLLQRRPDLKLVITSATIETDAFSRAFNNAPIIEVSGRLYPVEVIYRPFDHLAEELGDLTYIDAAVHAVEEILECHPPGDILIFMPGEKDIRETRDMLQGRFSSSHEIVPLFGRLSAGDQERVFTPSATPRIIIATNIAETSLTIPRIRYVIDSGLARSPGIAGAVDRDFGERHGDGRPRAAPSQPLAAGRPQYRDVCGLPGGRHARSSAASGRAFHKDSRRGSAGTRAHHESRIHVGSRGRE